MTEPSPGVYVVEVSNVHGSAIGRFGIGFASVFDPQLGLSRVDFIASRAGHGRESQSHVVEINVHVRAERDRSAFGRLAFVGANVYVRARNQVAIGLT